MALLNKILLFSFRLAGIQEQGRQQSLFKDETDLTVAVKYMMENGNGGLVGCLYRLSQWFI